MQKAIVIGGDHHNTLGMVRSLGIKGVLSDVYIITSRPDLPLQKRSKYMKNVFSFASEQEMVSKLVEEGPQYTTGRSVIFCGSDKAAEILDRNYEELKNYYVLFNAKGQMETLMNKENMCLMAAETGLNVPYHICVNTVNKRALPYGWEGLKFPCITKAISSLEGGKADTTICENENDLNDFLSVPGLCRIIQIEEFIEKEIEFQFIGLSINGGEEIIIPGHSHIHRPNGIQNEFWFLYKDNDDSFTETLYKTKVFIKRTGYSGLFSVEFLRGKDGKDYFLEMNFRNDGNAICVTDAGYNLPYIWYLFGTGGDYKKEISKSVFKPIIYCPEYYHLMHFAYGEISAWEWATTICRANSFTDYYKGDSEKFYWQKYFIRFGKQLIKKILIKIHVLKKPHNNIGGGFSYLNRKRVINKESGNSDRRRPP